MTTADQEALSVVGRGLVAWLTDHGPATAPQLNQHFASRYHEPDHEALHVIETELWELDRLGLVRRDPYVESGRVEQMWIAVAQPATTIHIQRPTEKPL